MPAFSPTRAVNEKRKPLQRGSRPTAAAAPAQAELTRRHREKAKAEAKKRPARGKAKRAAAPVPSFAKPTPRSAVSSFNIDELTAETAIMAKARTSSTRRSQLDVPVTGVSPGGRISIAATHSESSVATADAAVASLAPRLGIHVHSISLTFRDSATGRRTTLIYNRQGTNFVR
jgi:hypothetical protein